MTMAYSILPSEIDFQQYSFDFEEYVKNEMGLDIVSTAKKNGGNSSIKTLACSPSPRPPYGNTKLLSKTTSSRK